MRIVTMRHLKCHQNSQAQISRILFEIDERSKGGEPAITRKELDDLRNIGAEESLRIAMIVQYETPEEEWNEKSRQEREPA